MKDLAEDQKEREDAITRLRDLLAQASEVTGDPAGAKPHGVNPKDPKGDFKKADIASANLLSIFDRMVGGDKGDKGMQRG